jgi:signal transduction histidine kinase
MLRVLDTDSRRWPTDARVLLRTQIVPKRELVIRVSEEVQALNRAAFVQQQKEVAEIYGVAQRRLWRNLGLALAASFGIGLVAILYTGRLENRIRRQRIRDVQNASELQHLSAKLITAQEEERRSIARELHDEVGQVLTALKVELAVAQRTIEASGGAFQLLEDARSITEGAIATVRDLSHLLHPALLDDLGLPAAVEWYLRSFGRRHDIRAEVLHDRMEERLTPEIETSAYRIVQEALTNIAKHARATACRVYLQRLPHTVLITIEDNGAGFDPGDVQRPGGAGGLGLIGIRERASQLRGTVRLESAPGKGTRLTVELPARARATSTDRETGESSSSTFAPSPPVVVDG